MPVPSFPEALKKKKKNHLCPQAWNEAKIILALVNDSTTRHELTQREGKEGKRFKGVI